MNIKLIDFAAQTYERSSDEQARACVALFRPVWAAQARVADEARRALDGQVAAGAWSIPAENDLDRWYWEGTPLLSQAPVDLAAARIAAAARDVAQALADGGVLNPADAQALASCDWDRLVASTPTELAGCRPADYLDACAEAACGERGRAALLVLALALRPLLDPAAEALLSAVRGRVEGEGAHHAKPRTCPVPISARRGRANPTAAPSTARSAARPGSSNACAARGAARRTRSTCTTRASRATTCTACTSATSATATCARSSCRTTPCSPLPPRSRMP